MRFGTVDINGVRYRVVGNPIVESDDIRIVNPYPIAVGRPRVGAKAGQSPVVRARVPQELKAGVAALAERENRAESDIVRDAVAAYVEMKRVS